MAATVLNGSAGSDANAVSNSISVPGKQQPKQSFANKVIDGGRKQIGNPSDASQRRAPQKAWQPGMNPLTQRSTNPAQPNGIPSQNRGLGVKSTTSQETCTPDKHAHDRLLALYANAMGLPASVTVKNGDIFKGIFYGTTLESPESAYLLKMVQQHKVGNKAEVSRAQENSCDYIGTGKDYAMTFDVKDVIDLAFEGLIFSAQNVMVNGSNAAFRTDADISGNIAMRERDLQRWEPSTTSHVEMSLDSSGGAWDQFQVNEQLFGVKSDYDENIYTTRIDRSTPDYPQREAEAQRIARHIEGTAANNAHIREERGILHDDDGVDEEEKYSGVSRQAQDYPPLQSGQNNRYMAPAPSLAY